MNTRVSQLVLQAQGWREKGVLTGPPPVTATTRRSCWNWSMRKKKSILLLRPAPGTWRRRGRSKLPRAASRTTNISAMLRSWWPCRSTTRPWWRRKSAPRIGRSTAARRNGHSYLLSERNMMYYVCISLIHRTHIFCSGHAYFKIYILGVRNASCLNFSTVGRRFLSATADFDF